MKHQPRLAQGTGAQCTELYGRYVLESRGCYSCGCNINILAVSRSASESSVISRLIDRMSPSRHRSNTEGGLTEEQEDELGHIFKMIDGNRDGLVLKFELEQALLSLGQHPGEEEVTAIFHEHDAHRRGALDFAEFKRLMTNRLTYKNTREELTEAFRAIDRNHDGTIDVEELRRLMGATGFGLANPTTRDIFAEVDKDASGKIDLQEFVEYMMGT